MAMTIVEADRAVTGGVDTHLDVHVAAALDGIGGVLGVESFATSPAGYRELLEWMSSFGTVARVGVEGTGAYGAGLARYLHRQGVEVIEVDRATARPAVKPQVRPGRRRRGGACRPVRPGAGPGEDPGWQRARRSGRCWSPGGRHGRCG